MKSVTFLIKPASSLCNMRCTYCFYHDVAKHRETECMGIMSEDTAYNLIQKACEAIEHKGIIQFTLQGGEPTLAGLDFYEKWIQMEQEICTDSIQIYHSIQTNGLIIDKKWAEFLKEHQFLVGLSLDGPAEFHDAYRITAQNQPTFARVLDTLILLDQHQVDVNLVSVITKTSVQHPVQMYQTLKKLGNHPLQLIACLDSLDGQSENSLSADKYGYFLCQLYDCWLDDFRKGIYVSVRLFDDVLRMLMGMPATNCANRGLCGGYLTVEADGSLYPCDFYVLDDYRIGNIHDLSVGQAFQHDIYQSFIHQSRQRPHHCTDCRFLRICKGGCRREWINNTNPMCKAYFMFYEHALPSLYVIAKQQMSH